MSGQDRKENLEPFSTVTHARLRLCQGDTAAARRIVETILSRDPDHPEARELLIEMAARKRAGVPRRASESGELNAQTRRFRKALGRQDERRRVIERLEDWLRRIQRDTGGAHA